MADSRTGQRGDLATRDDIAELVTRFYGDVATDDLLGPVFNEIAGVNWAVHEETLIEFWSRLLLGESGYDGNPLEKHRRIHEQQAFTDAQFDRWLELFQRTVDASWSGPTSTRASTVARNVARVHRSQLGVESASGDVDPTAPQPIVISRPTATEGSSDGPSLELALGLGVIGASLLTFAVTVIAVAAGQGTMIDAIGVGLFAAGWGGPGFGVMAGGAWWAATDDELAHRR